MDDLDISSLPPVQESLSITVHIRVKPLPPSQSTPPTNMLQIIDDNQIVLHDHSPSPSNITPKPNNSP